MPVQPEAFFLRVKDGHRFCLFYPAQGGAVHGSVLYIHPFAEEMNKARRMAALQARALARVGYSVLQIDLLGCGDSSGDFGDATWESWVSDVVHARHWLRSRSYTSSTSASETPLWLWGLRAGCLLAAEAANQLDEACNFLFWQPSSTGKQVLQQFLRLKMAGAMLSGQAKGVMENMRQELANGSPVEIAGYTLSPGLAIGLEQAVLLPPGSTGQARRLEWLELSNRDDESMAPISTKAIASWQQSGFDVGSHTARGPAFWQTSEIEDAPALVVMTTNAISTSACTARTKTGSA